jgi:hypothetical protein
MKISNEKLFSWWQVIFLCWGFTPLIICFLFFLPTLSPSFLFIATSPLHFIAIITLGCLFFFFSFLELILFVVMWKKVINTMGKEKTKELLEELPWNKFLPFIVSIISIGLIVVVLIVVVPNLLNIKIVNNYWIWIWMGLWLFFVFSLYNFLKWYVDRFILILKNEKS